MKMLLLVLTCLLFLSLSNALPDCFVDNKQCLMTGDNLVSHTMGVATMEECTELCQKNAICTAFTHFGSENHFLSEACLLFSECKLRGECEECITGSRQEDCSCGIPYEGVKNANNLQGLFVNILDESACKTLCSTNKMCEAYTYYNDKDTTNPHTCALLSTGEFSGSAWPCNHCITGPVKCDVGQKCKVITMDRKIPALVEESSKLSFVSGEKDCFLTLSAVAIGSGGEGGDYGSWGRGGGSGYIETGTFNLTSKNTHLDIKIGYPETMIEIGGNVVLKAENGKSDAGYGGGDGYSGGGGINAAGGTAGGNGENGGYRGKRWPEGGKGSGLDVTKLSMENFVLTPGKGGDGSYGGGGGGVLVNGEGPYSGLYDGEGYGAGSGEDAGLSGCVLLEYN